MRRYTIAIAALALMSVCLPALAQSRRIMGGSAGGAKYQFFYDTFLDPALPELGNMGGGTIGGEGTIHRFMAIAANASTSVTTYRSKSWPNLIRTV